MPIRYYLSILVASCLIGGYLVEYIIDGRHNSYQSLADAHNDRLLIEKDFKYFKQNVSQVLIAADLIVGSGETYLADGAITQLERLLEQSQQLAGSSMLASRQQNTETLIQSLQEINNQVLSAASASGSNRNETLNNLLNEYDLSSVALVSSFGILDTTVTDAVREGEISLLAAKASLEQTRLFSVAIFSFIIFLLWLWSDRKISKPLTTLANIAKETESGARFSEITKAPAEVLQLSQRLAVATSSLIEQAQLDPLTHLLNRREFERRLTTVLNSPNANGSESPGVICYIDLDHFKIVNDTCGHAAGDEILIRVAAALSDTLRTTDIVSRLGGDEFGIVFVGCPLDKATNIAHRLRELVEKIDYKWNGEIFRISASIGLSEIPAGQTDLKAIVNTVDAACSAAKNGGRNRVQILDSSDASVAQTRNEMILVNQIYNAIEQSNFVLYSQPIVRLADNTHEISSHPRGSSSPGHEHFEILLRMLDSAGDVILPGKFLPTVERYQLSTGVDRWVVENTIAYLLKSKDVADNSSLVNINLSAHSIGNIEFNDFAVDLFEKNPSLGERICFEVTETAASADPLNAQAFVTNMRKFGVQFALDDFGSGHSSFSYLKMIAFDYIKIDGAFIQGMLKSAIDLETVVSVINLAKTTGATVIAEYVDKPEIEEKLIELGVQYGQGFLYSHPLPLGDLEAPRTQIAAAI